MTIMIRVLGNPLCRAFRVAGQRVVMFHSLRGTYVDADRYYLDMPAR